MDRVHPRRFAAPDRPPANGRVITAVALPVGDYRCNTIDMKRAIGPEALPYLAVEAATRLGEMVSVARRQRLWTQADLAAKAGVGITTLSEIERGSPRVQLAPATLREEPRL